MGISGAVATVTRSDCRTVRMLCSAILERACRLCGKSCRGKVYRQDGDAAFTGGQSCGASPRGLHGTQEERKPISAIFQRQAVATTGNRSFCRADESKAGDGEANVALRVDSRKMMLGRRAPFPHRRGCRQRLEGHIR